MANRVRIALSALTLGATLAGAGVMGVATAGATAASACAAIKNLPATYGTTAKTASSTQLGAAVTKVSIERNGVDRVVAAKGSAAVTKGYRGVAKDLSAEITSLQHARALIKAKASRAKVSAAIVVANADNVKADNARGAMGVAVVNLCVPGSTN